MEMESPFQGDEKDINKQQNQLKNEKGKDKT
jgi:hypothetical protein